MRTRKQIEQDAKPPKGSVAVPVWFMLVLILEVVLDIRDQQPAYEPEP